MEAHVCMYKLVKANIIKLITPNYSIGVKIFQQCWGKGGGVAPAGPPLSSAIAPDWSSVVVTGEGGRGARRRGRGQRTAY